MNSKVDGIIILAGGEGVRLRPLTYDMPKLMIPFLSETYLEYIINSVDNIICHNIPVIISAGYKSDCIDISNMHYTSIVKEDKPLGTGGAIRFTLQQSDFKNPLILNGDLVLNFFNDLSVMSNIHNTTPEWCTIMASEKYNPCRYGNIQHNNWIMTDFIEKPSSPKSFKSLVSTGIYIINSEKYLQFTKDYPDFFSIEKDIFAFCPPGIRIFQGGNFSDIGTIESYRETQIRLNGGESVINKNCKIHPTAVINNSVIHKNVTIGANVIIDKCIIAQSSIIQDNCQLKNICIASNSVLQKGTIC